MSRGTWTYPELPLKDASITAITVASGNRAGVKLSDFPSVHRPADCVDTVKRVGITRFSARGPIHRRRVVRRRAGSRIINGSCGGGGGDGGKG